MGLTVSTGRREQVHDIYPPLFHSVTAHSVRLYLFSGATQKAFRENLSETSATFKEMASKQDYLSQFTETFSETTANLD